MSDSKLTTHVLDTASGKPGSGIKIELYRLVANRELVNSTVTNSDGRTDAPLATGSDFAGGEYELDFHVGDYFSSDNPFLGVVTLRFSVTGGSHYHIPLLVSPYGYTTYRGS